MPAILHVESTVADANYKSLTDSSKMDSPKVGIAFSHSLDIDSEPEMSTYHQVDDLPAEREAVYSTYADTMNEQEVKKFAKEIGRELGESLRTLQPQPVPPRPPRLEGWHKALGVVVSVLVILGALFGMLKYIVSGEIRAAFEQPNKDLASLRDKDVGALRKDFEHMQADVARLLDWQARAVFASIPATLKPEEIKDAARHVRSSNSITVSPEQIKALADPLFKGLITPSKWDALEALTNLRSHLNTSPNGKAIVRVLRSADRKLLPAGFNEWVRVVNATISLDGKMGQEPTLVDETGNVPYHYLNVIFENCHIIYHGHPIKLTRVVFVDCTFQIDSNKQSEYFVKELLSSETTSLTVS